jgi:hypothetical protein
MSDETITVPDFEEADSLLGDLFADVQKWEGHLAGGTQLTVGATAVASLMETRLTFGNPRSSLIALNQDTFANAGVEINYIRDEQMRESHDFYYMTINVNLQPKPGAQFRSLTCKLNFGPKGADEPIVETIFPDTRWRDVLNFGGGMSLGLNGNLDWGVGVDATKAAEITKLPGELQASIANKNEMKSFIVMPDYRYELGRFDVAAFGAGNSECYWHIQEPDLQKTLTVPFAIVFKVPKGTESITLHGLAWAEPKMSWLTENVRNVFGDLGDKLKGALRRKDAAAHQFARGAAEEWTLPLPRKSGY